MPKKMSVEEINRMFAVPDPLMFSDAEINRQTVNYKRAQARIGLSLSQETRKKISETLRGRPAVIVKCPHCGEKGGHAAMHRWHFWHCKSNLIRTPVWQGEIYLVLCW